jgi:Mg-dependent DNase
MDNEYPYIDVHTHQIKPGNQIAIVNILVKKNVTDYPETQVIHQQTPNIFFSAGIHPWFSQNWRFQLEMVHHFAQLPHNIAIGECGLDKTVPMELNEQIELFKAQIIISETKYKPLIIHCVKAYNELLEIRKETQARMPWIIHGFSGSIQLARQCSGEGMILSFGQALFNSKSKVNQVVNAEDQFPFLLETDESHFSIDEIYAQYVKIKGITLNELKKALSETFFQAFKF